jgi:hypothetical protein
VLEMVQPLRLSVVPSRDSSERYADMNS